MRRKVRLYLQAMGSPGKHLSRGETWSDTGLRRVPLALGAQQRSVPLPLLLDTCPGLRLLLPSFLPTLHTSQQNSPFNFSRGRSAALQARPQGQAPTLACPRAQRRPVPRPSCFALFSEHGPLLSGLQAPPSNRLTWVTVANGRALPDC